MSNDIILFMTNLLKTSARKVTHAITNIRGYQYKQVEKYAKTVKNKKILEIGSGPLVKGKWHYSTEHLFDKSNSFLKSDILKTYGHPIVDVTNLKYKNEFDVILCLNVLEHVYDFKSAIENMHKALKKGGVAVIAVPVFYPLHDEPGDYWRFTEHSLRKLFGEFKMIKFVYNGKREYPFTYYFEVKK